MPCTATQQHAQAAVGKTGGSFLLLAAFYKKQECSIMVHSLERATGAVRARCVGARGGGGGGGAGAGGRRCTAC
jgi:hypothetical protein